MGQLEWNFDVQDESLKNGWTSVKLFIPEEVEKTFGKQGFVYQSLLGIRIRGSLFFSPIKLYRIES